MPDVNDWNARMIAEFRANAGKVGGNFEGAPVLLLTTTGRKSGRSYTNPMMYLRVDGGVAVFASKAGADTDPDWYLNAVANPSSIPMVRNYEDFFFGSCRPNSAMTFCRSFQTSAFAGGLRNKYAG